MARVTRAGGWVGATVWDLAGSRAPMAPLWEAVAEVAPEHPDESDLQGGSRASLVAILEAAGSRATSRSVELPVTVTHPTLRGVVGALPPRRRTGRGGHRRARPATARAGWRRPCAATSGEGPFDLTAVAYAARGRA